MRPVAGGGAISGQGWQPQLSPQSVDPILQHQLVQGIRRCMPLVHCFEHDLRHLQFSKIVELGSDQGRSFQLDLLGPAGTSPSHPQHGLLPNWATAAGRRLRCRDLCLGFREFMGTGTAAVLAGGVDLRPLRPPSFNTCHKLGGILHLKINLPIFELPEPLLTVGKLLVRQKLHIFGGHAAGCQPEVLLVEGGKSAELLPQPLPQFPTLLCIVSLPTGRFPVDVVLANTVPHSVDDLVGRDVWILDYTDPCLCKRDTLLNAPDCPLSLAASLRPRPIIGRCT